ncbi:hypothetical protein ACLKA6_009904 [Drosophila palustris]
MLSWLNPYNFWLYLMCKLSSRYSPCRQYLLQVYGHCYINRNYDIYSLARFPRWFWSVITGGGSLLVDTSLPECLMNFGFTFDEIYFELQLFEFWTFYSLLGEIGITS